MRSFAVYVESLAGNHDIFLNDIFIISVDEFGAANMIEGNTLIEGNSDAIDGLFSVISASIEEEAAIILGEV